MPKSNNKVVRGNAAHDGAGRARRATAPRDQLPSVGSCVRHHRQRAGLSLREFAKTLGVSASFISQLENGKAHPSVTTLFMICNALDVTFDELFRETSGADVSADGRTPSRPGTSEDGSPRTAGDAVADGPVVRAAQRRRLAFQTGIRWEQLATVDGHGDQFIVVTHQAGGTSETGERDAQHPGVDHGLVLSGRLRVTVGAESYVLRRGDSIAFEGTQPHQIANVGTSTARSVWFLRGVGHR